MKFLSSWDNLNSSIIDDCSSSCGTMSCNNSLLGSSGYSYSTFCYGSAFSPGTTYCSDSDSDVACKKMR